MPELFILSLVVIGVLIPAAIYEHFHPEDLSDHLEHEHTRVPTSSTARPHIPVQNRKPCRPHHCAYSLKAHELAPGNTKR